MVAAEDLHAYCTPLRRANFYVLVKELDEFVLLQLSSAQFLMSYILTTFFPSPLGKKSNVFCSSSGHFCPVCFIFHRIFAYNGCGLLPVVAESLTSDSPLSNFSFNLSPVEVRFLPQVFEFLQFRINKRFDISLS
jgi:hypothetical protein